MLQLNIGYSHSWPVLPTGHCSEWQFACHTVHHGTANAPKIQIVATGFHWGLLKGLLKCMWVLMHRKSHSNTCNKHKHFYNMCNIGLQELMTKFFVRWMCHLHYFPHLIYFSDTVEPHGSSIGCLCLQVVSVCQGHTLAYRNFHSSMHYIWVMTSNYNIYLDV